MKYQHMSLRDQILNAPTVEDAQWIFDRRDVSHPNRCRKTEKQVIRALATRKRQATQSF